MQSKIALCMCPAWSLETPPLSLGLLSGALKSKGKEVKQFHINLTSAMHVDKDIQEEILKCDGKISKSVLVGKHLAEKLKNNKINNIIFDRNGYKYHGRIKALAEAIRSAEITI